MKRKHKIVIAVVAVLILIIFGVVFCKMERAKMDRTIRNFFMALDQGNFEQLDKIMSEDAYFLQQSVYYYSIRDEMKERWDTIRYTAGEYIIYEYATGYGYIQGKASIAFEIPVYMESTQQSGIISGKIDFARDRNGEYKIVKINSSDYGDFGLFNYLLCGADLIR